MALRWCVASIDTIDFQRVAIFYREFFGGDERPPLRPIVTVEMRYQHPIKSVFGPANTDLVRRCCKVALMRLAVYSRSLRSAPWRYVWGDALCGAARGSVIDSPLGWGVRAMGGQIGDGDYRSEADG